VPAVRLAQQIAEQLHNYDLSDERIWVGEGETARLYQVRQLGHRIFTPPRTPSSSHTHASEPGCTRNGPHHGPAH
jgi:hypothetical protein